MADPYKGQKVTVKCQDCGCDFEISRSRHYKLLASENPIFRCKPCYKYWRKNVWYNELPDERRNELSSKRSELSKGVWANMSEEKKEETNMKKSATRINHSDEWKANVREKVQSTWQNKSDQEKSSYSEACRNNTQAFWDGLDDKGRKLMSQKMSEAQRTYMDSLSDEEKEARSKRIAEANRDWWAGLSDEERALVFQIRSEAQKKQWSEKSEESRNYIISQLVKGREEWWNNLSDEEKIEYGLRHKTEFWDKMTKEEFKEWSRKNLRGLKDLERNSLEIEFANLLNAYHIRFEEQWVNRLEHPDFDSRFLVNTATGSSRISPYHVWDFKVDCNNGPILVDLDGSLHDPTKADNVVLHSNLYVVLRDRIDFNDSKRPYQTDGLAAYVVQAYDDTLDNSVKVKDVKTGEIITFHQLMAILNFNNLSEKDKKAILRDS